MGDGRGQGMEEGGGGRRMEEGDGGMAEGDGDGGGVRRDGQRRDRGWDMFREELYNTQLANPLCSTHHRSRRIVHSSF